MFKVGLVWSNKRIIKGSDYFLITAPPTAQGQSVLHLCDYIFGTSLVAAQYHKNLLKTSKTGSPPCHHVDHSYHKQQRENHHHTVQT